MTDTLVFKMPVEDGEKSQILPKLSKTAQDRASGILEKEGAKEKKKKEYIERYFNDLVEGINTHNPVEIGRAAAQLNRAYLPEGTEFTLQKDLAERALKICIENETLWAIVSLLIIMKDLDRVLGEQVLDLWLINNRGLFWSEKYDQLALIANKMKGENALQICLDNYEKNIPTSKEIGHIAYNSEQISQNLGVKAVNICIDENDTWSLGEVIDKMQEIEEELGKSAVRICVKKEDAVAIRKVTKKIKTISLGLGKKALEVCINEQRGFDLGAIPDIAHKMGYTEATAYILELASHELCDSLTQREAWFVEAIKTLTGTPSESPESVPEAVVTGTKKRVSKLVPAKMIPANFPRKDTSNLSNKK